MQDNRNEIQEIVWIVEDYVMHKRNNNNIACKIIRNAKCLRDDFRMFNIVKDSFLALIGQFRRHDGHIMLTNANMVIGGIVKDNLSLDVSSDDRMRLGWLILTRLVSADYLVMGREPYFTLEQIKSNNITRTLRLQPYHLEMGVNFMDISFIEKERSGISLYKYPQWESNERMVGGIKSKLVKSKVNTIESKAEYVKAVNNLESVKWIVNPDVARVSESLEDDITSTTIVLKDINNKDRVFDVRDIRRGSFNKQLIGVDLYKDGAIFQPEKGNATTVKTIESELNKLFRRVRSLKDGGKVALKIKEQIKETEVLFEAHNQNWIAKQYCLAKQSKAARDKAILETINGPSGWASYSFYQSMFLDFRGRIYAKDPFFSYQSSDLARGHLMFNEKRLMTDKGYRWMMIHTANSFNKSYTINELNKLDWLEVDYVTDLKADGIPDLSVDKMSLNDRFRWAEENIELLWDIAEDPLKNKDIWMDAEKPWVFLSLCFEVCAYHGSLLSGDEYYTRLPISIDGSSNGTQHLAAMSRDEVSGGMVGLIPKDKPIDFYIIVAKGIINRNIGTDLGAVLAKIPMKLIRKGISKRGSMTKAYDAGVNCIADIIYTDCYNAGMTTKYGITKSIARKLSKDLVDTYNTICSGPVAIKNYLQSVVKYVMKDEGHSCVTWSTPSGFPVISEKWVTRQKDVSLFYKNKKIVLVYREQTEIPAIHEVMSGISPNYVHSMDASHMSLVINELHDMGITSFGAIHDSYSVHADDVEDLVRVTKSVFINMYDRDIFGHIRKDMAGIGYTEHPPKLGRLDISKVVDSDYFFC